MPRELELCPGRRIGGDHPCFIIAEIGQNHQGDLDIAKRMIRMAKECGADCAKFQKSELEYKFNKKALERPYASKHSWGKTYGEHKRHLEFSHDQYRELKKYAEEVGIFFTASGMDELDSMATVLDYRCTVCLDSVTDASHVMPCMHRFCFGCVRRWVQRRRKCPLCRGRMMSIRHSVSADSFFEEFVLGQNEPRGRRARRRRRVRTRAHRAAPLLQPQSVSQLLLPRLRQELRQLFGADHGAHSAVQRLVSSGLSFFGLDEAALTARLLSSLQSQAARFAR